MLFKRTTSVAGAEHAESFSIVLRSTFGSVCRLKCAAVVVNCITFDYDKVRRLGTHLNLMASYAEFINAWYYVNAVIPNSNVHRKYFRIEKKAPLQILKWTSSSPNTTTDQQPLNIWICTGHWPFRECGVRASLKKISLNK